MKLNDYFNGLGRDDKRVFIDEVANKCDLSRHTASVYVYGKRPVPAKYGFIISKITHGKLSPHLICSSIPVNITVK